MTKSLASEKMSKTKSPTKLKTRSKLLMSAKKAIAEKGFDLVTIEDITSGANVGFGTFYNHFQSKQDIAEALFLKQIDDMLFLIKTISEKEKDLHYIIAYIQKVILKKAIIDKSWGWFVIKSYASHDIMTSAFISDASTHLENGKNQNIFFIDNVDLVAKITISSLFTVMKDLLNGEYKYNNISTELVKSMMLLYGVENNLATEISKCTLPKYLNDLIDP
ncbi:TetR/AcrR family transcriptional regulator [Acinetobacter modestus]|uniref:TetR/AcrR family transcriptional regulator n=1 Tax=Acinetobacter modestus TaxID=1776740 RepID=UPI00202E814C|nr:TetR/AcrR family transcriptional regulator [Acinetobacter modestus]MCM1959130.1 TetR/AcrR family transcriptional regulator [Acinetobacter modestus]